MKCVLVFYDVDDVIAVWRSESNVGFTSVPNRDAYFKRREKKTGKKHHFRYISHMFNLRVLKQQPKEDMLVYY